LTPQEENIEASAKRVSVVIVSFNRVQSLRQSLAALGDAHQILVVDNGSTDGSANLDGEFPGVRFIRLPKNFGLTRAMNIGVRAADGEYVLFLHDDACITGAAVTQLADFLEARQDVGAVCPLLVKDSALPAPQVRAQPRPAQPDPPLRALRQIDERYGNYGNIIELCAQVRRASRKLVILRDVTALHEELESPGHGGALAGDRTTGTAEFLGKHYGFMAGLVYRIKAALGGLVTFRFSVVGGALSNVKIDGS